MALPVTLAQAKAQLRVDGDEQDVEIDRFIRDAAAWVETHTGHILEARDVTESFVGFKPVSLRAWPIFDAAVPGVAYVDAGGAAVAVLGARLDLRRRPARVLPAAGAFWNFTNADQPFSVTVRAGYENPDDVPGNVRRAMLLLIGAYDADREGGDVFVKAEAAARRLCDRFKKRLV